jgi:hypothetical protein
VCWDTIIHTLLKLNLPCDNTMTPDASHSSRSASFIARLSLNLTAAASAQSSGDFVGNHEVVDSYPGHMSGLFFAGANHPARQEAGERINSLTGIFFCPPGQSYFVSSCACCAGLVNRRRFTCWLTVSLVP